MKKKAKLWVKRISAVSMAALIVLMSFFPIVTYGEGNFKPGTFSPGTFSPGTFSPGTFSPGQFSPGTFSPGQFSPGEFSPGEFSPGEFSPGTFTPGEFSPEDFSPGPGGQPGQFTPGQTTPGNYPNGVPGSEPGGDNGTPNPSTTNPPTLEHPTDDTQGPANGNSGNSHDNSNNNSPGGSNSSGDSERFPFSDDPNYQALTFITKDMLFPAIEGLDRHTLIDIDWDRYDLELGQSMTTSLLRNQLGNIFQGDSLLSGVGNLGLDVWNGVDHAKHLSGFFSSWTDIRSAWNAATTTGGSFSSFTSGGSSVLSNLTKPFDMGTGIAGKAAPWMAAVSTGISGAETIMNFANGNNVDGFASLGETLMSGAVVLSATGVGAPIAAGVAIAGGVLWAGAMVVKHKDTIVKAAKAVGNGVKKAAKAVGDAVKGGVDVVKSGFKKIAGWFG